MSINTAPLNTTAINSSPIRTLFYDLSGKVSVLSGITVYNLAGQVRVQQPVQYSLTGPIAVFQFQSLVPTHSGITLKVIVNGRTLDILGEVTVRGQESIARTAEFTEQLDTVPPINSLIGQPVTIDYIETEGATIVLQERLFTGFVDFANYTHRIGYLSYICNDNLVEDMDDRDNDEIVQLVDGFYSEDVFEDLKGFELFRAILETLPVSMEKNRFGQLVKSAYKVGSLNFTLNSLDDLEDVDTDVEIADMRDLTNTIDLTFDYRFNRLLQRHANYSWGGTDVCKISTEYFLTNDAVESALDGLGGVVKTLSYVELPPNGGYDCFRGDGLSVDTLFFASPFVRSVTNNGFSAEVYRRFSRQITEQYKIRIISETSVEKFKERRVEDTDAIDIDFDTQLWDGTSAPANAGLFNRIGVSSSINRGGTFAAGAVAGGSSGIGTGGTAGGSFGTALGGAGVNAKCETEDELSALATPGASLPNGDFFLDREDQARFERAILSIINQLRVDILQSHRENIVDATVALIPSLELSQYGRIVSTRLRATGKVGEFVHRFNVDTGESKTDLRLFVSRTDNTASVVESDFTVVPTRPDTKTGPDDPCLDTATKVVGIFTRAPGSNGGNIPTFLGGTGRPLANTEGKNAFIKNSQRPVAEPFYDTEGLQLIFPELNTGDDQGEGVFEADQTYIVFVPNDELVEGLV